MRTYEFYIKLAGAKYPVVAATEDGELDFTVYMPEDLDFDPPKACCTQDTAPDNIRSLIEQKISEIKAEDTGYRGERD